MIADSLFTKIYHRCDVKLHLGYSYKTPGNFLKRVLSNQMFGSNPVVDAFLRYLEPYLVQHVESVKQIKIFANPAIHKNETDLN